jgi:hypothetical protein
MEIDMSFTSLTIIREHLKEANKMKAYLRIMIPSVIILCIQISTAYADQLVTASRSLDNLGVIVAIHPYASREDRRDFNFVGKYKHLLPVGVFIRNQGPEQVSIKDIEIKGHDTDWIGVDRTSPYIERPAGGIMGRRMDNDAAGISLELDGQFGVGAGRRLLRMNEIFSCDIVKPGEDCFGIVYVDRRNSTKHPASVKDLGAIEMNVLIIPASLTRAGVARFMLDGGEPPPAESIVKQREPGEHRASGLDLLYVGPQQSKPAPQELFRVLGALDDCAKRGVGDVPVYRTWKYGRYATVKIVYDRSGKQLKRTLEKSSGYSMLDKRANDIVEKMKECKVPAVAAPRGVAEDDVPYYEFVVSIGDPLAAMRDDKIAESRPAGKDNEQE